MPDREPPPAARVAPGQRLYLRFYLALLASLGLTTSLFALAHLQFDTALRLGRMMHMRHPALDLVIVLVLIAALVALGAYPVVRRLTGRLERLQRSVDAWGEGRLSARVAVEGADEVAVLAQSFNRSAGRIEALVRAQKSLLANASHELRSPLARIRMAVELLQDQVAPAMRDELRHNVAELDQLIDELLLASRLDAVGAQAAQLEDMDLTALVAEECARAGATLDAVPGRLQGDPRLLRRMVRNLLDNARRYGGDTPVTVQLRQAGDGFELDVCDGGPGIGAAECERIFEPFYRVPGASEAAGGVGLGLSLVRQIASLHGGSVRCLPNDGGGCRFRVALRATLHQSPTRA